MIDRVINGKNGLEDMVVKENFALFVEGTEVKWTFGNPSQEFLEIVSNFLMGVSKLGKEFFGEGIASITFDRKKRSGIKAAEIFIVSLEDTFFLIMSDPAVTLLLIQASGGIPEDIKAIMLAVLVGQASILYASSITEADDEAKNIIDSQFHDILLDLDERFLKEDLIQSVVGPYGSNFSLLSFEECLLLHYYLRRHAERAKDTYAAPKGRAMVANLEGWEVPLSWNMEREGVWAGFFAAIIGFIYSLFESKPKSITFGSTEIHELRFIYGEKTYFMTLDTSLVSDLLLKRDFREALLGMNYAVLKDMAIGIKKLIIEEIQEYSEFKLNKLRVETLLDTYVGEDEMLDLTIDERVLRIWGKILLSFQLEKFKK